MTRISRGIVPADFFYIIGDSTWKKGLAKEERTSTKKLMSQLTEENIDRIFPVEERQNRFLPDSQLFYQSHDLLIPAPFRRLPKDLQ